MIEGVFGRIEGGCAIGWAYHHDDATPIEIVIKRNRKTIARGIADQLRPDLVKVATLQDGRVGFRVLLPKGPKQWHNVEVYGNGQLLNKAAHLQTLIEKSRRILTLEMEQPHFFIHIPKTAGTAFKKLLEKQFTASEFFPSRNMVDQNGGLYPHFPQLIKLEQPDKSPSILLGHYPYATQQVVKGVPKKIVILRDPVQRVISNIYHMKNNDHNMKDKTPEQIYQVGKWHFSNLQVRYLCDKGIHPNMGFLNARTLKKQQLKVAIQNLRSCEVVGISSALSATVQLANKVLGWNLSHPKQVNVARSPKVISEDLIKKIIVDNKFDQRLFEVATRRFNNLCNTHSIDLT